MDHGQLVRLRDDINKVLSDPDSWLYLVGDEFDARDADPPDGFDCETADFESPFDAA